MYIYDTVTGENIMKLELPKGDSYYSDSVVRDCAWHPYSQTLISTSFHGAIHKWEYMDFRDAERCERNNGIFASLQQQQQPVYRPLGDRNLSVSSDDSMEIDDEDQVSTDLP